MPQDSGIATDHNKFSSDIITTDNIDKNDKKNSAVSINDDPVVPDFKISQGPLRPYMHTEPAESISIARNVTTIKEKILLFSLAVFTGLIRLYNIPYPDSVVFDEVHFGGFASQYIRGTFFMDVHPPLAKMLYAAVANMADFNGDFDFKTIGEKFPQTAPYVIMRMFSGILGSLTVLIMYLTLRFSGVHIIIALLASICFAMENSYVTISRYILLDAPLMFFIAFTAYAFKRFEMYPSNTFKSYKGLFTTGIALGFALSSKWVGLFTLTWIGLLCIWRLWFMIGDLQRKPSSIVKSIIAKILFLLLLPTVIYVFMFKIHFNILTQEGDGSGFMSSEFRSTLAGNTIPTDMQRDVGITSFVTLRHTGTMGGYLHSHDHKYETGSRQQQITLYPHLDDNNKWIIELATNPGITVPSFENLTDGTTIRLLHANTHCRLHSHDHTPPVSELSDWQKEVSCYGFAGFNGDVNDDWIIQIDKDETPKGEAQEHIVALKTKFRLRHSLTGCYLFSHEVKLPDWGFQQQEVTCATQGKHFLTLWYIEGNENPIAPENAPRTNYKLSTFWDKLIESHKVMWHINKNLVDSHFYASYPDSWPFLSRGINYWNQENRNVYLLGNLAMWWSVSLFVVIFIGIVILELVSWQLGKPILTDSHVINFHIQVIHYLLGFALHYIPSFLMKRQMFLHHYLPAYYFGILALAHAFDIVYSYVFKKKKYYGVAIMAIFTLGCIYFYVNYKPLIYGTEWTKQACEKSKLLSGWDYNCNTYFDTYEEYSQINNTTLIDKSVEPSV